MTLNQMIQDAYYQLSDRDKALADCYPVGADNAIPAEELGNIIGISPRRLLDRSKKLRLQGFPVCAGDDGYFIPDSPDQLTRYYHRERSRNQSNTDNLKAVRDMIDRLTGEQSQ